MITADLLSSDAACILARLNLALAQRRVLEEELSLARPIQIASASA